MQDVKAVANYFIERGNAENVGDINVKKLQDLIYCAHGWCLGITKKPLLSAKILASRDGPEIPDIVEAVAGYGTKRVTEPLGDLQAADGDQMRMIAPSVPESDPDIKVLNLTWKAYGRLAAFDLSRITQAVEGPWDRLWNDPDRSSGMPVIIPDDVISTWFQEFAERNRKRTRAPTVNDTQRIEVGRLRQV